VELDAGTALDEGDAFRARATFGASAALPPARALGARAESSNNPRAASSPSGTAATRTSLYWLS
jgi:hypothetical protein